MWAKAVMLAAFGAAASTMLCPPSASAGGAGGDATQAPAQIVAWVMSASGGGVAPPVGTSSCTPWARETSGVLGPGPPGPGGVPMNLYVRSCGGVVQGAWVPVLPPEDLARVATDRLRELLPVPAAVLSPPADRNVVNVETWLSVANPGPVSATVGLPGISVTATASPSSTVWDLGNGERRSCPGLGVGWARSYGDRFVAPCGYTYAWYSKDQPGDRYAASVTLVWTTSWTASTGETGVLDDLLTVTPIALHVGEIQTVEVPAR